MAQFAQEQKEMQDSVPGVFIVLGLYNFALLAEHSLLLLSQALRRDFGGLCDTQTNMMQHCSPVTTC